MTNMPSYRLDIDMGHLDDARIVITTGQSGNPSDPHYGDLIDDWLARPAGAARRSAGSVATPESRPPWRRP